MSTEVVDIEVIEPTIEVVEITVEENPTLSAIAAAQAAQAALAEVISYLTLLNQANVFVEVGDITLSSNNITFEAVWKWLLLSTPYQINTDVTINIPFCATGKTRIDLLLATTANTFIRYAGPEVAEPLAPVAPTPPVNTLVAGFVVVTDSIVNPPVLETTPVYLGHFTSKNEFDTTIPRVPVGSYGYIKNATQNILCQYTAAGWTFLELNTYRKFVEWSTGNSRSIPVAEGVQVKNVFINETPIYSTADSSTYGRWLQTGTNVVISEDALFDDQSRILITN